MQPQPGCLRRPSTIMLAHIITPFIPSNLRAESEEERRAILLVATILMFLLVAVVALVMILIKHIQLTPYTFVLSLLPAASFLGILELLRFVQSLKWPASMFIIVINVATLGHCIIDARGVQSAVFIWLLLTPLFGALFLGTRVGIAMLALIIFEAWALAATEPWFPNSAPHFISILQSSYGLAFNITAFFCIVGTVILVYEATQANVKQRLEDTLREKESLLRELRVAMEIKSKFVANISHEIRTPVHGICEHARCLGDYAHGNPQIGEIAQIISDCAETLLSLVDGVLDFQGISTGRIKLESIEFDIVKEATAVINSLCRAAQEKGISIELDTRKLYTRRYRGDNNRWRQVLFNLLSNAIKFSHVEGKVEVRLASLPLTSDCNTATTSHGSADNVKINSDEPCDVVEGRVVDFGIGIPENQLEKIFEGFSQADASAERKYGGAGLGLAVSRKLCRIMGGDITVRSVVQQGSTFTFSVVMPRADPASPKSSQHPLEPPRLCMLKPEQIGKFATAVTSCTAESTSLKGIRVLVVEDNLVNRKVAVRMLASLGCEAIVAESGIAALQLLEQGERFDIILLDLQMPLLDGFSTAARVRQLEQARRHREQQADTIAAQSSAPRFLREVPIVALTASATEEYRQRCLRECRMADFLTKPLRRERLAEALRRVVAARTPTLEERNRTEEASESHRIAEVIAQAGRETAGRTNEQDLSVAESCVVVL